MRGPEGDTLWAFGRSLEADEVTSSEAEAARATLREQPRDLADGATLGYELPDTKPLFSGITGDPTGHWWVRRYRWARPESQEPSGAEDPASSDSEPYRYDVFDPEGRFLGSVETDELGVEYVAVYELVKPEGA